jgi:hypothetical protein
VPCHGQRTCQPGVQICGGTPASCCIVMRTSQQCCEHALTHCCVCLCGCR